MSIKTLWLALLICCSGITAWAVYRDIYTEEQYPGDLRNRIVGARLEKDHVSPYFYKWKPGQPLRYYDPYNDNHDTASNITATPFFHHLVGPVADLPGLTISRIWLAVEYLLLALSVGIGLLLASTGTQKMMVCALGALLLLTEAWKSHIANGQYYLMLPFLALVFYYFLRMPHRWWAGMIAGLAAVSLVMIRPNSLVFFLPFLLVVKRFPARYILAFLLPVALLAGWSVFNKQERSYWTDYKQLLGIEVQDHQSEVLHPIERTARTYACQYWRQPAWEGWNGPHIDSIAAHHPYHNYSENGNLFVIYFKLFHAQLNPVLLSVLSVVSILSLLFMYRWKLKRAGAVDMNQLAIFAFCLYMVCDLYSPIFRHQYYTIQWLCPLVLAAAAYRPSQKWYFVLLGLGILLNIVNLPFMKMEHTTGEYLLMVVLLLMCFLQQPVSQREQQSIMNH